MNYLRTEEMDQKYTDAIAQGVLVGPCVLCTKTSLSEFSHWRILKNDFPYDRIASRHDMLVPKRHTAGADFTEEELFELRTLKEETLQVPYEFFIEATHHQKSIPAHFHLHLLVTHR